MQVLPFIAILASAVSAELFDLHGVFFEEEEDSFESLSASGKKVLVGSGSAMKMEWDKEKSTLRDTKTNMFLHIDGGNKEGAKKVVTLNSKEQEGYTFPGDFLAYKDDAAFTSCGGELHFNDFEGECEAVRITKLSKSEVKKQLDLEMMNNDKDDFDLEMRDDDEDNFDLEMRDDDDAEEEGLEKRKESKDGPGRNGQSFKIVASRKGSPDMPIKKVKNQPYKLFVGGEGQDEVLKYQGKTVVDQDGRALALNGRLKTLGEVAPRKKPANDLKIDKDSRFRVGRSEKWYACDVDNKQVLAKRCKKGKGKLITLYAAKA